MRLLEPRPQRRRRKIYSTYSILRYKVLDTRSMPKSAGWRECPPFATTYTPARLFASEKEAHSQ